MKKFNSPLSVVAVLFVLLFTSIVLNFKFISLANAQRATIHTLQGNGFMVNEYKKALNLVDTIMDNNDIYDKDGSDAMYEYLNIRATLDSTYHKSIPNNALLDSIAFLYDE